MAEREKYEPQWAVRYDNEHPTLVGPFDTKEAGQRWASGQTYDPERIVSWVVEPLHAPAHNGSGPDRG